MQKGGREILYDFTKKRRSHIKDTEIILLYMDFTSLQ